MSKAERAINARALTGVDLLGSGTTPYVVALTTTHASGSVAGVWTADPASALSGRTVTVEGSSVTVNVVSGPPVCTIGDAAYGTLADAFAAVVPGAETTIALIGDITAQAYGVVAADAKIKLDLAGHTITGGDVLDAATGEAVGCVIKVLGELMISVVYVVSQCSPPCPRLGLPFRRRAWRSARLPRASPRRSPSSCATPRRLPSPSRR